MAIGKTRDGVAQRRCCSGWRIPARPASSRSVMVNATRQTYNAYGTMPVTIAKLSGCATPMSARKCAM